MSSRLGRNALILASTSAGSYIFGLVRDRLLAQSFGASRSVDIFNSAFLLPDLIMNLFAAALTTAFIPVFAQLLKRQDATKAYQAANSVLTVVLVALGMINLAALLLMPWITPWIAPGFSTTELAQLTAASRWMLLSPLLFGISILLGAVLQGQHRFFAYALSPMLYNLGIVIGILLFAPQFGIQGVIYGVIMGAGLHLLIRLLASWRIGYRPRVQAQAFTHPAVHNTLKLMGPRIIGLLAVQASLWTFNAVGSTLQEGSVAVFNFARNFQSLPVSFIGIAIATVLFPVLAADAAAEQHDQMLKNAKAAMRTILLFTLPAMIGMMLVSKPLIAVFLGGGEFDEAAITRTTITLIVFALAIPLESLQHILARLFYAQHDTRTPAIISVIGAVLNVVVCLLGAMWFGVAGLAVGFVAMSFCIDLLLVWRLPKLIDTTMVRSFLQCLVASLIMGGLVWLGHALTSSVLAQLVFMAGIGAVSYTTIIWISGNQDIRLVLKQFKR
jgi:putative peptidoglycan lipid II flippase